MKKARIALALLVGLAISSCKKEYSIENGNNVMGNFVARIDGTPWAATSNAEQVTMVQGLINITGISSDNKEISMTITDTAVGTYILNQQSTSLAAYMDIDSSDVYAFSTNQGTDSTQAGGWVTISQIDRVNKTITGTFAFKVYRGIDGRQHAITAGAFTKLVYTTTLPPTSPSDTMKAVIDGSAWTAVSIQASINSGELTLVGASSDGSRSIGLLMPSNATAGAYPLDGSNSQYIGVFTLLVNAATSGCISDQGTLDILANDTTTKRIRGNFQFTAVNPAAPNASPHSIASGFFSVYYGP